MFQEIVWGTRFLGVQQRSWQWPYNVDHGFGLFWPSSTNTLLAATKKCYSGNGNETGGGSIMEMSIQLKVCSDFFVAVPSL